MFAEEALLLLPDIDINVNVVSMEFINKVNTICTAFEKGGMSIHIPYVCDHMDLMSFNYKRLNVTVKPDEAVLRMAKYNTDGLYSSGWIDRVKADILKDNPVRRGVSVEELFQDARKRVQKILRKIIKRYDCVIVPDIKSNLLLNVTDKSINPSAMLLRVGMNGHVKIKYGDLNLEEAFLENFL